MNTKTVNREINKGKRKVRKKAKSAIGAGVLILWAAVLIVGTAAGFGAAYLASSNDCFGLVGEKELKVPVDGKMYTFKDPGAKVVEFGRDISDIVSAETSLEKDGDGNYLIDASKEGIYHIIYTVDSPRFGGVKRVRTITVGGEA